MKKDEYALKLDLQTFAEDDPTPPNDPPADPPQDPPAEPNLDDLLKNKAVQGEIDRRVTKALETAKTKWETELETKLSEAEKLAKMNADQKAEYERKQREDKLAEREAEITRRELRAQALETLAEKGLPKELADILVFTDADSTKESLDAVETSFRAAVEAGVNERLKGNPPKGGGSGPRGEDNPWDYDNENLTKQGQILRDDPAKAAQLKASAKKQKEK